LNNAIRRIIQHAYSYHMFENFCLHIVVEHGNLPAILPLI
jgi:hypothetical protein